MHASHISIEPLGNELGTCARLVQTGFDDVILMNAVRNFAGPQRDPAEFLAASIAFNEQHIVLLQPTRVHLFVRYVDHLDLTQVERTALDVGDTEIGARVLIGSVRRAFLESVGYGRDVTKLDDVKPRFRWGVPEQSCLQDPFMTPSFDVLEAGDLKRAFGEIRRGRQTKHSFEFPLCLAFDLQGLRFEFGRLVQSLLVGGNQVVLVSE